MLWYMQVLLTMSYIMRRSLASYAQAIVGASPLPHDGELCQGNDCAILFSEAERA